MAGNEAGYGRFGDLLRALFNLQAQSPAPEIGGLILPTIHVNDLADETLFYLRGERRCLSYVASPAGGAGNFTYAGLLNPAASGVLGVIESLSVYCDAAAYLVMLLNGAIGPGMIGQRAIRDTRAVPGVPIITPNYVAQATDPTTHAARIGMFQPTTALSYVIGAPFFPIVLQPGTQLWIGASTVATPNLWATWGWRERSLGDLEVRRP